MTPAQLLNQAMGLLQSGRGRDAVPLFRQVIAAVPDNPDGWAGLGVALMTLGQIDDGRTALEKALTIKPGHIPARQNLGMAMLQAGRFEAAEKHLGKVAAKQTKDPGVLMAHGVALSKCGQHGKAVRQLRAALTLAPGHPQIRRNLATALVEKGDIDDGLKILDELAAATPDDPGLQFNRGIALTEARRYHEAVAAYRRALAAAPQSVDILNNLGNLLLRNGHWTEAAEALSEAHRLQPGNPYLLKNLARAQTVRGRLEDARQAYEQVEGIVPGDLETGLGLATTYLYQGRFDDALPVLDTLEAAHPNNPAILCRRIDSRSGEVDDAQVAALTAHLADESLPVDDRAECGFALGRALMTRNRDDDAFDAYAQANALRAETYAGDYDADADDAYARDLANAIGDAGETAPVPVDSEGPTPLFIVGMPRSGTSLIEQMVSMHPDVAGGGELPGILELADQLTDQSEVPYPEVVATLDEPTCQQAREHYLSILHEAGDDKNATFITDKMPDNVWHVGLVAKLFPEAPIIHCTRNPMATGFSIFQQSFSSYLPWAYDLTSIGRRTKAYRSLVKVLDRAPLPRPIVTATYEDVVRDPATELQSVVAQCGLDWDSAVLDFGKNTRAVRTASYWQVRQSLYASSLETWKRFERKLTPMAEAMGMT